MLGAESRPVSAMSSEKLGSSTFNVSSDGLVHHVDGLKEALGDSEVRQRTRRWIHVPYIPFFYRHKPYTVVSSAL